MSELEHYLMQLQICIEERVESQRRHSQTAVRSWQLLARPETTTSMTATTIVPFQIFVTAIHAIDTGDNLHRDTNTTERQLN